MFFIVGGAAMSCSAGFYMLPETFQGTLKNIQKKEKDEAVLATVDQMEQEEQVDSSEKWYVFFQVNTHFKSSQ